MSWINDSPTKWSFLSMTEYEKILFLDSDMIVVGPIIDLFSLSTPAAMFDDQNAEKYCKMKDYIQLSAKSTGFKNWYSDDLIHGSQIEPSLIERLKLHSKSQFSINGGLILITPKEGLLEAYIKYIGTLDLDKTLSGIDEISIVLFMHDMGYTWTHVDMKYNTSAYKCSAIINDIRILHYIGPYKPWYEGQAEYNKTIENETTRKQMEKMQSLWEQVYNL